MIKFLIPFFLATSIACAEESPNLGKLYNHFDPMASEWQGNLKTVAPPLAHITPSPVATPALGNKCSTDDIKTIHDYLHSFGYTAILQADDRTRNNVVDEVMYNMNDNSILAITLFYDKPLKDAGDDKETLKPIKVCTEFQGINTYGDGAAFKKFVLGQKMAELNAKSDEHNEFLLKGSKGELKDKDGDTIHDDPYQGDPSKIGYIPLD